MGKYFYNNISKTPIIDSDQDAIIMEVMGKLEYFKKIIDKLGNNNSKCKTETIKSTKYFEKLTKEFNKYKITYPGNVSIKNGNV